MGMIGLIPTILIGAAMLPSILILVYVNRQDKVDKEPTKLLISLVLLGALSALPTLIVELIGEKVLDAIRFDSSYTYMFFEYFIVVALAEEGFKYLFMRKRTWKDINFNCTFDGVVYAVFVSMGFAILENIVYVLGDGIGVAITRAVTSVPGHACFAVFMGVFYSMAKRSELRGEYAKSRVLEMLSLVVSVLLHGMYDFCLSAEWVLAFIGYIAIAFGIAFMVLRKAAKEDRYITEMGE